MACSQVEGAETAGAERRVQRSGCRVTGDEEVFGCPACDDDPATGIDLYGPDAVGTSPVINHHAGSAERRVQRPVGIDTGQCDVRAIGFHVTSDDDLSIGWLDSRRVALVIFRSTEGDEQLPIAAEARVQGAVGPTDRHRAVVVRTAVGRAGAGCANLGVSAVVHQKRFMDLVFTGTPEQAVIVRAGK